MSNAPKTISPTEFQLLLSEIEHKQYKIIKTERRFDITKIHLQFFAVPFEHEYHVMLDNMEANNQTLPEYLAAIEADITYACKVSIVVRFLLDDNCQKTKLAEVFPELYEEFVC